MSEEQKARVKGLMAKPVGDYTEEEGRFMTDMMRRFPVEFADILEEEVRALRQAADRLRHRAATVASRG